MLLAVLVFILVSSLAASTLFSSSATHTQREKEEQLLFAGDQIRRAIVSYYNTVPPGGARTLPPTLDALLTDQRFPVPVHHLRRLYLDPMTGRADWQLVVVDGRLVGVSSKSQASPLKHAGFPQAYVRFGAAQRYSDWVFRIQ